MPSHYFYVSCKIRNRIVWSVPMEHFARVARFRVNMEPHVRTTGSECTIIITKRYVSDMTQEQVLDTTRCDDAEFLRLKAMRDDV